MKKLIVVFCFLTIGSGLRAQGFENFISRQNASLMDGNEVYRFLSWNIPTLNYVEDNLAFTEMNPYALPTEFELRDAFATVKEMGGQVIRIYTIPVRNKNFPADAPTYVEGPGQFNEEAFKTTDLMLALANEYEVRIIFSLLNNWQWMGGVPNYADFRGKGQKKFWTDRQLIEDFKQTVQFTVERTNTLTGVPYKEDKAILCWETGNELQAPYQWTKEMVAYIKQLDPNHLVMDGYYAVDGRTVMQEAVEDPNVDILSSHHYERDPFEIGANIQKNVEVINGAKPYVVGEFGFSSTSSIEAILDQIIQNESITGALAWSLRRHSPNGGFYWHSEPDGNGFYKAYHWPGFKSGQAYNERALMKLYRAKAFEIQGKQPAPISKPLPPNLLPIEESYAITWQGSMGATGYNIERATSPEGPWECVGFNISDAAIQYQPLFNDRGAPLGQPIYYRAFALNEAGVSAPSEVVGPVTFNRSALVDNLDNRGFLFEQKNTEVVTGSDRSFKEDMYRLKGHYGSEAIYRSPGTFRGLNLYSFEERAWPFLELMVSEDGQAWHKVEPEVQNFINDERNYNYWVPKIYHLEPIEEVQYIKVYFKSTAQIGRVELFYK